LSEGRFQYLKSLQEIYAPVMRWKSEGKLAGRIRTLAAIRGKTVRANANPFCVIIGAVSDRDRRTVSRWSLQLNKALAAGTKPKSLIRTLRAPAWFPQIIFVR
jgi:hypothetical protein